VLVKSGLHVLITV